MRKKSRSLWENLLASISSMPVSIGLLESDWRTTTSGQLKLLLITLIRLPLLALSYVLIITVGLTVIIASFAASLFHDGSLYPVFIMMFLTALIAIINLNIFSRKK